MHIAKEGHIYPVDKYTADQKYAIETTHKIILHLAIAAHEAKTEEHIELLSRLTTLTEKIILPYFDHPLVRMEVK
jgi:hypothetical protein